MSVNLGTSGKFSDLFFAHDKPRCLETCALKPLLKDNFELLKKVHLLMYSNKVRLFAGSKAKVLKWRGNSMILLQRNPVNQSLWARVHCGVLASESKVLDLIPSNQF